MSPDLWYKWVLSEYFSDLADLKSSRPAVSHVGHWWRQGSLNLAKIVTVLRKSATLPVAHVLGQWMSESSMLKTLSLWVEFGQVVYMCVLYRVTKRPKDGDTLHNWEGSIISQFTSRLTAQWRPISAPLAMLVHCITHRTIYIDWLYYDSLLRTLAMFLYKLKNWCCVVVIQAFTVKPLKAS